MEFMETIAEKWNAFVEKATPVFQKIGRFFRKAGNVIALVWGYVLRFKRIILAVPVAIGAIYLAMRNMDVLPNKVGMGLQLDGTFDYIVAREVAVLGPIAITALCLLLMFCSKRVLTPWLVSIFSLAIPLLLWVLNVYPA